MIQYYFYLQIENEIKMLRRFRHLVDRPIAKIGVVIIAMIFVFAAILDLMKSSGDYDIVKFASLKNIKLSEFSRSLRESAGMMNEGLEETPEKKANIKNLVLFSLIKKRISAAWVQDVGVSISDKIIAGQIKSSSQFHDENGKFDIYMFKNFLARLHISEQDFYEDLRLNIAKNLLESVTAKSVYAPKLYKTIASEAQSAHRVAELVTLKLSDKLPDNELKFQEKELREFYGKNLEKFQSEESRAVKFITIPYSRFINLEEVDQDSRLRYIADEIKSIEDSVAGGDSLDEIAGRYKVKIQDSAADAKGFASNKTFSKFSDQIFGMNQDEVSYPLDEEDKKYILLFRLVGISPSQVAPFESVKKSASDLYAKEILEQKNKKSVEEFIAKAEKDGLQSAAQLNKKEFKVVDVKFTEEDSKEKSQLNAKIFESDVGKLSSPIYAGDVVYIFKVTKEYVDKSEAEKIFAKNQKNIQDSLIFGILENIGQYYYTKNTPIVDYKTIDAWF
ncbi:MAG: SurA N-terminal domain-containing protein [Rickettsiaceae bacterium]|nr:SurA N-terminal domain-containing protein [Rickettsiaceae bacterium]